MQIRSYRAGWLATLTILGLASLARAQGTAPTPPPAEPGGHGPGTAETVRSAAEQPDTAPASRVDTEASTEQGPEAAPSAEAQPAASTTTPTSPALGPVAAAEVGADEGLAAAATVPSKTDDKGDGEKKPPWEKDSKTKVRGLLRALWILDDTDSGPKHEFRIASARVELQWKHSKMLEAAVELDAAQDDNAVAWSALRDAYVRVKPLRELRLRMGQFKKPFSRLELRGRRQLVLVDRGISNAWIVEDLGYGDRDIGFQVEGRFGKETTLSYEVGAFNGSGRNSREADLDGSKDFAARLELNHNDWLSLGVSGSHQRFDPDVTPLLPRSGTMGAADFRLKAGELRVLGEAMFGENQLSIDHAESWSALLLASYKIPLTETWRMALEPLAKVELLKVEHHVRDAHIWSGTVGANYHLGRYFRLMAQGEWIRPSANTFDFWPESHRLLVQALVDLR